MGGHSGGHGQAGGAYGVNCGPTGGGYYNGGAYGAGNGACGVGGGYGVAGNGYGGAGAGYGAGGAYGQGAGAGFGQAGYGAGGAYGQGAGAGFGQAPGYGAGYGAGGAYGPSAGIVGAGLAANGVGGAYGAGAYGAGGTTVLGANAPYGAAAYGQNVVGTSYSNGQYVQGAGVQTIQGAPIYVPQPYAQYYGVPQLRGVGAALPFGLGVLAGTEFDIGGDVFTAKAAGLSDGGGGNAGAIEAISYNDAFDSAKIIGGTAGFDLNRQTTVFGTATYGDANGNTVDTGSFAAFAPGTTTAGPARELSGELSDLETYTLEGGVRRYVGANSGIRPYVGASGGFTYNNDVTITQTFDDDGSLFGEQEFIESGWRPTAAGLIGAEMAVGPRAAIGIESGIRWRDNLKTAADDAQDRWTIPLSLRGRVAF